MTNSLLAAAIEAQALERCQSEQIHIPGSIQPHGALLALYPDGTLAACSENAGMLLGALPAIGELFGEPHLGSAVRAAMQDYADAPGDANASVTVQIRQDTFDIVMHHSEGLLIVELERRIEHAAPPFEQQAQMAPRAISRICGAASLHGMLDVAVGEIRRLTGFDRVMAYQFLQDDSGEVLTESKLESMDTLLGLRFPAGDIPPQARRLYVANPIRLIADCNYSAVPVFPSHNGLTQTPIDMSHSVLRSVSPVHLEYLKNMGVAASMSISIVVSGRLWGLFACHHTTPRLVPHELRMACVVLSDIVSALVERRLAEVNLRELRSVDGFKKTLLAAADGAADMLNAFDGCGDAMLKIVDAKGYAVTLGGLCANHGDTPAPTEILDLIASALLPVGEQPFACSQLPASSISVTGRACGAMAICFNAEQDGYIFWFRNEQIENLRWAGNPEKSVQTGPLGAHLAPRRSFAMWQEEVRGRSIAWRDNEKQIAAHLKNELKAIALEKLRISRSELQKLASHQERSKEVERMRIARDIHDDLGQNLMVLRIDLSRISALSELSAKARKELQMIQGQVDATIKSVRYIINDLRPGVLELGLKAAIEWQVMEFKKRSGIACQLHMDTDELVLEEHYATAMFRIIQESLSNIMRHAKANSVEIEIHRKDNKLLIKINDDGIGLRSDYRKKENAFGLAGIEERIRSFAGTVSIKSNPGKGLEIKLLVPIPQWNMEKPMAGSKNVALELRPDAPATTALHFLIYVSRSVAPMSGQALNELLKKSRDFNRSVGITGCLIYQDGFFMQMLEGPREAVFALCEKIKTDPRHRDVGIVIEAPARRRIFVDWSMGLRDLTPEPDEPDFDAWQRRTISFLELSEDARTCYAYITSEMRLSMSIHGLG
jgi:light-regulated signal transduction histidine kinase (bacteriophytochrome)